MICNPMQGHDLSEQADKEWEKTAWEQWTLWNTYGESAWSYVAWVERLSWRGNSKTCEEGQESLVIE